MLINQVCTIRERSAVISLILGFFMIYFMANRKERIGFAPCEKGVGHEIVSFRRCFSMDSPPAR